MDLDHVFTFHKPVGDKSERYERLRAAHKAYAEALISDRILDQDNNLILELAYDDIIRVYRELTPCEAPETERAIQFINEAYDLAVDPDRAIVLLVQGACYFANASVALEK